MLKQIYILLCCLSIPTSLTANCYNSEDYPDDPRTFEVCLDGNCIEDQLMWECANTSWAGAEFSSGYTVSCEVIVQGSGYDAVSSTSVCTRRLGEFVLSKSMMKLFTCKPVGETSYGCEWYGKR